MARHAHEDALSEREFEELVGGAKLLKPPWNLEAMFVVFVGGRLGLRAGEIAHLRREWVSYETGMIDIPSHEPCRKGRDGGRCGYCRRQARRVVANADDDDLELEDVIDSYWNPKTSASERAIPFEFDDRIVNIVQAFFEFYDAVPFSVATVRRRVKMAAEASEVARRLYPHCLRATAATHHAYNGLGVVSLQAMMGWRKLATAEKYLRLSGGRTKRALHEVYD